MTKLFVVGFPGEMDEMQLAQLFGPYGDILLLTIARDKENGKCKGFGFIQMDDEGAKQAIAALNGYTLYDRQLEVRIAVDKREPAKPSFIKPRTNSVRPEANVPVRKKRPRLSK